MNRAETHSPGRLRDGRPDLSTVAGRSIAFAERVEILTGLAVNGGSGMSYEAALEKMRKTDGDLLEKMGGGKGPDVDCSAHLHDLTNPEVRRKLWNSRLDMLCGPKSKGGEELSLDEAIEAMRHSPPDIPLLRAMGAEIPSAKPA